MTAGCAVDPTGSGPAAAGRLPGVDVARGIAVLGMFATHFNPGQLDPDNLLRQVVSGRSAVLFAVLAGVSVALLSGAGRDGPRPGDRSALVARAVLLFGVGLGLSALGTTVKEILTVYGLLFLAAIPLLRWRPAVLMSVATVLAVVGPVLSFVLRSGPVPTGVPGRTPSLLNLTSVEGLADTATGLLLDGPYPVVTWLPFLLLGLAIGRSDLRDMTVQRRLLKLGSLAAVAAQLGSWLLTRPLGGFAAIAAALRIDITAVHQIADQSLGAVPTEHPGFLLIAGPHTGAPLEIVSAAGVAAAALGACVLVTRSAAQFVAPLAAVGRLALTCYAGHIVLIAAVGFTGLVELLARYGYLPLVVLLTITLGAATAWTRLIGHGPLEAALSRIAAAARRTTGGSASTRRHRTMGPCR